MNYFIYAFKNIFNYKGRARRAEYGWFLLMNVLLQLGVYIFLLVLAGGVSLLPSINGTENTLLAGSVGLIAVFLMVILYIYSFVSSLVILSLTARRLHDLGWSGWWQLAFYFVPLFILVGLLVLFPIIEQSSFDPTSIISDVLSLTIFGWFVMILILLFKDGQKHPNKYGESPKYPSQSVEDNAQALN